MSIRMKVVYNDGRVVEVKTTPRAQIMTERHMKGITATNKLQASYFLAWLSLKAAGEETAEYEPWLDLIDDIDEISSFWQDVRDLLESYDLLDSEHAEPILELAARIEADKEADKDADPTRLTASTGSSSS